MSVDGFDWDDGNLFKSEAKHGISKETVEAFFSREVWVGPDPRHSSAEDRHLAIGREPGGRPMIVAFTIRQRTGQKLIRPISARYMHAKEARRYEEAFTPNED